MPIGNAARLATLVAAHRARTGAPKYGISTQSGNASATVFTIAHGLGGVPTRKWVQPITNAAWGKNALTADATNLIITFVTAPPTASGNLKFAWYANATVG